MAPDRMNVCVSFGGLLMSLTGPTTNLRELQQEARVYLKLKSG